MPRKRTEIQKLIELVQDADEATQGLMREIVLSLTPKPAAAAPIKRPRKPRQAKKAEAGMEKFAECELPGHRI